MSEKRYPTRMHEVLGVAENEEFYSEDKMLLRVNHLGRIERKMDTHPCGWDLMCNTRRVEDCINNGIIRKRKLDGCQIHLLMLLSLDLGLRWLTIDSAGVIVAWEEKPVRIAHSWVRNVEDINRYVVSSNKCPDLATIVSWSDPEPLDIVQTLRDAGVVVSEMEKTTDEGVE